MNAPTNEDEARRVAEAIHVDAKRVFYAFGILTEEEEGEISRLNATDDIEVMWEIYEYASEGGGVEQEALRMILISTKSIEIMQRVLAAASEGSGLEQDAVRKIIKLTPEPAEG